MEQDQLYLCDPRKNVECPKTNCVHNPDTLNQACYATTNPDFALVDFAGERLPLPPLPVAPRQEGRWREC